MRFSCPTVSMADAARLLKVTTTSIRRWIDQGRFPPAVQVLPSGRQRFAMADIERVIAWMNERAAARAQGLPDVPPPDWATPTPEAAPPAASQEQAEPCLPG